MSPRKTMRSVWSPVLTSWVALAALSIVPPAHGAGSKLTPAGLRCEYSLNPLGIDDLHPGLS